MAGAASDKKALDIVIMDMRKMAGVCDYFVIASGASTTQVRAIADNIVNKLKEISEKLWHMEGEKEALWILLDYGDVVAHVFLDETRRFYNLERLWGDAPQLHFKEGKIKKERSRKKKKAVPRKKKARAAKKIRKRPRQK